MRSIEEIYQKKKISAEEIANATTTEQKKCVILEIEENKRMFKEEEYSYLTLTVEMNRETRKLNLSRENAYEIAKIAGNNPEKWLNYILLLHAIKDEKGYYKLGLSVWGKA